MSTEALTRNASPEDGRTAHADGTHTWQKGYIMFTIDNRGSSNRGLTFENATFRRLGIEEGKDR